MSNGTKKVERITTPAGIAKYPWLSNPDVRFKKEGIYSVKLVIPKAEAEALMAKLDELAAEAFNEAVENAKTPQLKKSIVQKAAYEPVYDEDGNETGEVEFKFKTNASGMTAAGKAYEFKPKAFDTAGNNIEMPNVYGGSKLKVNFTPSKYFVASSKTAGVSLMLNAVQIIDLVTGGGGTAESYGFGAEEGGFNTAQTADEPAGDGSGTPDF